MHKKKKEMYRKQEHETEDDETEDDETEDDGLCAHSLKKLAKHRKHEGVVYGHRTRVCQ